MLEKDMLIYETESVKNALKKLDKTAKRGLIVVDTKDRLLGAISDGDIRRYILDGRGLEKNIKGVYNKNPIYLEKENYSEEAAKKIIKENGITILPVVDAGHRVTDLITLDELLLKGVIEPFKKSSINIPVAIMAGGRGLRLDPFTKILPKPLIPVGDKPVIERIIEEFEKQGVDEFYLSLNHKSEMIELYFKGIDKNYKIKFIKEKKFLGTAGSLKFLQNKVKGSFIVTNCDVIVKADYADVVDSHKTQQSFLTILAPVCHYRIPYGVIEFKKGGEVGNIIEKPEYSLIINSGVYILEKATLQFIKQNSPLDMPDLIKTLIRNKKKVVIYPVNEKDYIDIGQWDEYKKTIAYLHKGGII